MWTLITRSAVVLIGLLFVHAIPSSAQREPIRKFERIAGELYRFQNDFHYSVFLVTGDGIIATDPINADAAKWLSGELRKRFNQPVKYLIYSHDHPDHISGGEVFADEAVVVAHDNAKATIIGEKRSAVVPNVTFSNKMTIELGRQTVELQYVGRGHSDNLIVMNFPAQRALFAVDFVSVKRLPFRNLGDAYFPDWMEGLKVVEGMDFDVLVPGHGPMGKKQDVRNHRAYLDNLYEKVLKAARGGKSLQQMQQSIRLEKYKDWGQYESWLPLNIEGMYRNIQLHRRGN